MAGGPWDFSVSPRPLGFGFWGFGVLGLRVWGQGLTISINIISLSAKYVVPITWMKENDCDWIH